MGDKIACGLCQTPDIVPESAIVTDDMNRQTLFKQQSKLIFKPTCQKKNKISLKDLISTFPDKQKNISLNVYSKKITNFLRQVIKNKSNHNNDPNKFRFSNALQQPPSTIQKIDFSNPTVYYGNKDNKGLKNGFGVQIWPRGDKFVGYFKNDKANGYGKFFLVGNINYIGEFLNNSLNGFGIYNHCTGDSYEGEWVSEHQHGIGIEIMKDGSIYRGEFSDGKKNGIGIYHWVDGSEYYGKWRNNYFDEYGIYHFNDGRKFYGEWKNNTMNGFGEFIWTNGKKYIGFYKEDKKHGFGLYSWETPLKIFLGFWRNGKQHGVGKYIDRTKIAYGIWKNGMKLRWIEEDEIKNFVSFEDEVFIKFFCLDLNALVEYIHKTEEEFYRIDEGKEIEKEDIKE